MEKSWERKKERERERESWRSDEEDELGVEDDREKISKKWLSKKFSWFCVSFFFFTISSAWSPLDGQFLLLIPTFIVFSFLSFSLPHPCFFQSLGSIRTQAVWCVCVFFFFWMTINGRSDLKFCDIRIEGIGIKMDGWGVGDYLTWIGEKKNEGHWGFTRIELRFFFFVNVLVNQTTVFTVWNRHFDYVSPEPK